MIPRLVSFDCAQTLVRVNWSVGRFALDCAASIGLDLPPTAGGRYAQMYAERLPEFLRVNATRDHRQGEQFWLELARAWLREVGEPESMAEPLQRAADDLGFGPDSTIFSLFDDVMPCLDRLKELGCRLAVISNWDYSLGKTLRALGILDRFECVIASLEEGFEKPDPRIFRLVLDRFGVEPADAVHVGDDAHDDLQGARNVGMRAALIDRARTQSTPPYLQSLDHLPEAFRWIS